LQISDFELLPFSVSSAYLPALSLVEGREASFSVLAPKFARSSHLRRD